MSDENNVETVGTSLEEAMQSNVQEQAAEHASSVEEAQHEDATPAAPAAEEAEGTAESTDAAGESTDAAEPAATEAEAEGAAPEAGEDESEDAAYRKRLRAFTRELKKQPGQWTSSSATPATKTR